MVEHAAREHSQWSASATERNWQCAGALALTDGLPETSSEAADWGTCAHQLAEKCFREHKPADSYIGTTEKGKSHEFEVDEEMAETAQTYVDYVEEVRASDIFKSQVWIEQHFTLNSLKTPFDAGGTADAVIYLPKIKTLEVVDLKGGRGVVVEVKDNPQGRSYALGAVLAHPELKVTWVKVTIVQPRAPHKDGRIRSETFHIADLVEWTSDLLAAMRRAERAMSDRLTYQATPYATTLFRGEPLAKLGVSVPQDEWAAKYLKPGDHCKFCGAKPFCPAIEQASKALVGLWFDDLDQPRFEPVNASDDPVERARKLDLLDMMEDWIAAYRVTEKARAEAGDPADGYVLVEAEGREKWNDGVEEQVIGAAVLAQLPEKKYLNPGKLRTPKQIRKELGSKAKLVAGLSSTPITGHNLVRQTKTTRAPIEGTAARFFDSSAS